jgi:hypothetical protein
MSASLCHGNGSHAAFKGGGSPNLTGRSGQGNHRSPSPQFFQALLYSGQEPVRRTTSMGPVNELLLPVAAILLFGLVYAVNWALTVRRCCPLHRRTGAPRLSCPVANRKRLPPTLAPGTTGQKPRPYSRCLPKNCQPCSGAYPGMVLPKSSSMVKAAIDFAFRSPLHPPPCLGRLDLQGDAELFFRLHRKLLFFVNQRLR